MRIQQPGRAEAMSVKLLDAGYEHIQERDQWNIKPNGKCALVTLAS